jgi:hypothetical protein
VWFLEVTQALEAIVTEIKAALRQVAVLHCEEMASAERRAIRQVYRLPLTLTLRQRCTISVAT